MADNFLEKQMADYRAGRLNKPVPSVSVKSRRVFIVTADLAEAERLVRQYRSEGCRTAFTCTDAKAGAALAQATGSQLHHVADLTDLTLEHSLRYINRRWGGLDLLLDLR